MRSPINPVGGFACKLCFPILRVAHEFIVTELKLQIYETVLRRLLHSTLWVFGGKCLK